MEPLILTLKQPQNSWLGYNFAENFTAPDLLIPQIEALCKILPDTVAVSVGIREGFL